MTTLKQGGKQLLNISRSAQKTGRRSFFAYARSRMSNAAIHDRARRAAVRTRIGILSHPFHGDPAHSASLRAQMKSILAEYGGRRAEVVALPAGAADRLFAMVAHELGIRLSLVIPCQNFQDFFATPYDISEYVELRVVADSQTMLDYATFDREAFEKASKFVIDTCDLLVIVGSGKKSAPHALTGSIVQYAHEKGKELVWLDPEVPRMGPRLSLIR